MASPNAGLITGREHLRVLEGGVRIWATRPQVAALLAVPTVPVPRPLGAQQFSALQGDELFEATQNGHRITLSAADLTAYLASSQTGGNPPGNGQFSGPQGSEFFIGLQDGQPMCFSIAEVLTILSLGGGGPIHISISGTPGAGVSGTAYSFTPTTANGSGTKVFALTGSLPSGLSFSTTTGAITGTPSATGTTSGLSITVTDTTGPATLGPFSITVSGVGLGMTALSAAQWSVAYTPSKSITGGSGAYSIAGLPPGVTGSFAGSTLTFAGAPN